MRTIYGFFLFVSIFGAVSFLNAEEPRKFPYVFSTGVSTGFLYGEGEEIVYFYDKVNDGNASQLLWDVKPMFYIGSSLYFDQEDPLKKWGFFGALDLKFGVPGLKTGTMEDRDWDTNNTLIGFSSHTNATEGAMLLDFSAGFSFPIQNVLYIRMYGVLSYTHFKWASRDGHSQYADGAYPSANDAPANSVYGPAINYSQDWFEFTLGISVYYPFIKYFTLGFSAQFVPLVILTHGRDDHLERDTQFDDYMSKGASFKPKGEISFSPTSRLSISLFVRGIIMFEISGPSYRRYSGVEGTETAGGTVTGESDELLLDAGAAFRALDVGLLFKVKL